MGDFSRKRKKGYDTNNIVEIIDWRIDGGQLSQSKAFDPLIFITDNKNPHIFDLHRFANGWEFAPHKNAAPFSGRPHLIQELAPSIKEIYGKSPATTCRTFENGLVAWWRILDACESISPTSGVSDLNAIHYSTYRQSANSAAGVILRLFDHARVRLDLPSLYWNVVQAEPEERSVLNIKQVGKLYQKLKRFAFAALHRYRQDAFATPTKNEIVFLSTVLLIQSGWNPQVTVDIDVEDRDEKGDLCCIIRDPQSPERETLVSAKDRAQGNRQYANDLKDRELSPAGIVRVLTEQTEPLRQRLRKNLIALQQELVNKKRLSTLIQ
jgi:hypothetical protein